MNSTTFSSSRADLRSQTRSFWRGYGRLRKAERWNTSFVSRTRLLRTKNSARNSNRSPTFSPPNTTRSIPNHVHEDPPSASIGDRDLDHPLIFGGAGDQDPSD